MGFCWDIHVSPEEVKKQIYGCCHCDISVFRISEMSFWHPKEYGLFCAMKGNCLFFSIHIKRFWGHNYSKRHLRICIKGDNNNCSLYGSFQFSDFISYLIGALIICIIEGVKTRFAHPEYYILFLIGCFGVWFFQCMIGVLVFQKDEKLLLNEVNMLLNKIAESKTEQGEDPLSNPEIDEKKQ